MSLRISRARLVLKHALKVVLGGFAGCLMVRRRGAGIRVLFYHRVNPFPFAWLGPVSRELTVTPEAFESQLAWLRRKNFHSASPDELQNVLAGHQDADPRSIVITFDDGFEDNFLWAHPLLLKYGYQGVFFISTQFIGTESGPDWTVGDMPGCGRFLNWDQLRQMQREGAMIGSHTCSHRLLVGLGPQELRHELEASRAVLALQLGMPIHWFAYPAGDHDPGVRAAVAAAGYRLAFTTVPGRSASGMDALAMPRSEISASDSLLTFRMKLAGWLDWTCFKEAPAFRRVLGAVNRYLIQRMARI